MWVLPIPWQDRTMVYLFFARDRSTASWPGQISPPIAVSENLTGFLRNSSRALSPLARLRIGDGIAHLHPLHAWHHDHLDIIPRFRGLHRHTLNPGWNVHVHAGTEDRKSTRLNSSHSQISYAVFCLKKR